MTTESDERTHEGLAKPRLTDSNDKRRLLFLVRTAFTLAIGYLLIFSSQQTEMPDSHLAFVAVYLGSNLLITMAPSRLLTSAWFDIVLVLADTAATSFALYLIPEANTDVFVFYFVIVLLASMSDRIAIIALAPVVTSVAYLVFLIARHGLEEVLQPAILLRLPFFLLVGAFYGFFVDRVRREQLARAAAEERTRARTEFLSLITHDLKQPLWIAQQSATDLFHKLDGDEESRFLAAQVIVSLRRMEALTGNFLDLDRIEQRGILVFPRKASLNRIVSDLLDAYEPALVSGKLHTEVVLGSDLPAVQVDPPQLHRALSNLLDNAIKFTPEGGKITVRTECVEDGVEILVGDTGSGIPPERAANLFTAYQAGRSTAQRRSTGLGLYITRAIVRAHGGAIELDPGRDEGAWFRIRLPIAVAEETGAPVTDVRHVAAA